MKNDRIIDIRVVYEEYMNTYPGRIFVNRAILRSTTASTSTFTLFPQISVGNASPKLQRQYNSSC